MYRYYSTQRPVMPGTYPIEKKVSEIVNFSERKYVVNISREAWGWIEFEELLTEKEEKDYELVREFSELERTWKVISKERKGTIWKLLDRHIQNITRN